MKTLQASKKITLATVKAFAKRNADNLYSKELSRFDGMIDCVMPTKDDFAKSKINEDSEREFVSGCWFVGSSRDSFSIYEDPEYFGIRIHNCCGSSIFAIKKQPATVELINWDDVETEVEEENKKREKIEAYEQRKAEKIERLREKAEKAKTESEKAYKTASEIASFIPMGQPILVGHHSESRHRRDLARIDSGMQKSIEADKKSGYYESKAERLEKNNVISSDDPAAIDKLKAKLTGLEQAQELMKACNAIIREKTTLPAAKVAKMVKLGLTEKQAYQLLQPDYLGRVGFAQYSFSNNLQNISTVKKRIAQLEKSQSQDASEEEINGVRIVDNPEANRIQVFFDGIPAESIRSKLKLSGFRWTPSQKCWQSYRNQWNKDRAKSIVESMELAEI